MEIVSVELSFVINTIFYTMRGTKSDIIANVNKIRHDGVICGELYHERLSNPTYSTEFILRTWKSLEASEEKIKKADQLLIELKDL